MHFTRSNLSDWMSIYVGNKLLIPYRVILYIEDPQSSHFGCSDFKHHETILYIVQIKKQDEGKFRIDRK